MSGIIGLLLGYLASLLTPAIMKGRRLTGAQFVTSVIVSAVLWAAAWDWFCSKWAAVAVPRMGDWLPPAYLSFFYPFEITLAPFLDGAILFTAIVFRLKLLNYPEGLSEDELAAWCKALQKRYIRGMLTFAGFYVAYLIVTRLIARFL